LVYTPKKRMLNAYKGIFSDRYPVAPEFWSLYPAKVLGVSMIEFEREIPFWESLQHIFRMHKTEGWGAAFPQVNNPDLDIKVELKKVKGTQYLETTNLRFKGIPFEKSKIYDENEPSWIKKHLINRVDDLEPALEMELSDKSEFDFNKVNSAHKSVGEDYLLEMWMGTPFFDSQTSERSGISKMVALPSESRGRKETYSAHWAGQNRQRRFCIQGLPWCMIPFIFLQN
jgi:hypothetical protein